MENNPKRLSFKKRDNQLVPGIGLDNAGLLYLQPDASLTF